MAFIDDVLDCDLLPQVYVLEGPAEPWRPLLRDDPFDSTPYEDDTDRADLFDIL